ncbi:MAG: hypothetical protein PHW76_03870 [Alphaproteobacteria bacterium]|nr:hypothetical protein [Alphaproteobacteria bacterium]
MESRIRGRQIFYLHQLFLVSRLPAFYVFSNSVDVIFFLKKGNKMDNVSIDPQKLLIASDSDAIGTIKAFGRDIAYFATIADVLFKKEFNEHVDPIDTSLIFSEKALKWRYTGDTEQRYLGGLLLTAFLTNNICVSITDKEETDGHKEIREELERKGDLVSIADDNGKRTIYFTKQLITALAENGWGHLNAKSSKELACSILGVEPDHFKTALDINATYPIPPNERQDAAHYLFSIALEKVSSPGLN